MQLRKSPKRTRALLAANRANSRKSTGPRTAAGKRHSAWNAVRHGRRARASCRCIPLASRDLKTFLDFYCKLHDAILPAESLVGEQVVLNKALEAWKVKRFLDRWIETRTEEDWERLAARAAPLPSFFRLKLRRPGLSVPDWTVTITVWLRWGRGAGRWRSPVPEDSAKPARPRMHTMVSVHSTGPGRTSCSREGLETERTKPEDDRVQMGSENMSPPGDWDPDLAVAYALADRLIRRLTGGSKRTKPECNRRQESYKNMSGHGASPVRNPDTSGRATRLGRIFGAVRAALTSRKEPSQLQLFQTKPECHRKEGASQIISRSLGWLGAAVSSVLW